MSTIIVYRTKKRLVKSGKDIILKGAVFFPVRKKYLPNWEKNIS